MENIEFFLYLFLFASAIILINSLVYANGLLQTSDDPRFDDEGYSNKEICELSAGKYIVLDDGYACDYPSGPTNQGVLNLSGGCINEILNIQT